MHCCRKNDVWIIARTGASGLPLERLAFEHGYRLNAICDVLGCSVRHIHEVFLRDIGLPPKRWLKDQRMVLARKMICAGIKPGDAAGRLGFATASNFGREFENVYDVSPGKFRREQESRSLGRVGRR